MTTWDQPSLFADTAGPVRSTDPDTAAEAAAQPGRSTLRQRVLVALLTYGAMSDEEIAGVLAEQDRKDSVSKRRSELRDAGLVEDTGERTRTRRGSSTIVWALSQEGRRVAFDG